MTSTLKIILILFLGILNISTVFAEEGKEIKYKDRIKIYILIDSETQDGLAKSIKVIIENVSDKEVSIGANALTAKAVGTTIYNKIKETTNGPNGFSYSSADRKEDVKYIKIKPGEFFGKKIHLTKEKYFKISEAKNEGDIELETSFMFYIDGNIENFPSEFKF